MRENGDGKMVGRGSGISRGVMSMLLVGFIAAANADTTVAGGQSVSPVGLGSDANAIEAVYYPESRTLDQHIANLRKKIEVDPDSPEIILTIHGTGYRMSRDLWN